MKLYKSWLLLATCIIILAVTTYATTQLPAKQIQAEVNLQHVDVSPVRPLKYGDKTTKKITNKEVQFLPTSPTLNNNNNSINIVSATGKQHNSVNQPRSRAEHRERQQISRRYDSISQQNLLDVRHEIPIAQKNRELLQRPTTASVGQQRTSTSTSTRTRSSNTLTQTQPPSNSNLNNESENNFSKTKTTHKRRQRIPTTTSHSLASTNIHQTTTLSSHTSTVRTQHATGSNSTIARHYHSNQRNRNNNNINSSSQPLLSSSNGINTSAGGLLSKTESSSNKRTGNISDNQSVSYNEMNNIRSNARKFTSNASSITIISSTSASITTVATTSRPSFQLPNSFNIFTPEFWQFLNPTSNPIRRLQLTTTATPTTTRRPPKKYKPPTQISTKEEKLNLVKPKPTILSRTTTKQPSFGTNSNNNRNNYNNNTLKRNEGPFRIALPTSNILSSKRETNDEREKGKRNVEKEIINLRERFDCPRESEVRFQLFPKICKIDDDCKVWNREEICCEIFGAKSCVSGIPKPLEETSHSPILGVIPRKCPSRPLAELWWEVKECEGDMDCWPRVCCPDGRRRYCRTSQPELNTVPVPVQRSFNYLSEYLECTPPPPPIFDLHPKPCTSTLDCFPNVCCQEAGLRHCRPPKKSVLTMLANVFNVDFVKRLTQNIVIK